MGPHGLARPPAQILGKPLSRNEDQVVGGWSRVGCQSGRDAGLMTCRQCFSARPFAAAPGYYKISLLVVLFAHGRAHER